MPTDPNPGLQRSISRYTGGRFGAPVPVSESTNTDRSRSPLTTPEGRAADEPVYAARAAAYYRRQDSLSRPMAYQDAAANARSESDAETLAETLEAQNLTTPHLDSMQRSITMPVNPATLLNPDVK